MLNLPYKPIKDIHLTEIEERCVVYYVMFEYSGITRSDAFKYFIAPTLTTASGSPRPMPTKITLGNFAKAFFERKDVAKFEKEYRNTLTAFLEGRNVVAELDIKSKLESIKEKTISKLYDAFQGQTPTELLKDLSGIADKLGAFDGEETDIRPPERYLPVCCSECKYKVAIDEALSKGKAEDMCLKCKYKDYANENGVEYEYKNQYKI